MRFFLTQLGKKYPCSSPLDLISHTEFFSRIQNDIQLSSSIDSFKSSQNISKKDVANASIPIMSGKIEFLSHRNLNHLGNEESVIASSNPVAQFNGGAINQLMNITLGETSLSSKARTNSLSSQGSVLSRSSGSQEQRKNTPVEYAKETIANVQPLSASSTIQSVDDRESDTDSLDLIELAQLPRL